jgi:hypothetical protein
MIRQIGTTGLQDVKNRTASFEALSKAHVFERYLRVSLEQMLILVGTASNRGDGVRP